MEISLPASSLALAAAASFFSASAAFFALFACYMKAENVWWVQLLMYMQYTFVATHLLTADLSSGVIAASAAAFSAAAFFFSASAAIRASLAKCVDHL